MTTKVEIRPSNEVASPVVQTHLHCAIAGQNGDVILDLLPDGIDDDVLSGVIVRGECFNADLGEGDCVEACGFEVVDIASLRAAADEDCLYSTSTPRISPRARSGANCSPTRSGSSSRRRRCSRKIAA